MCHLQELHAKYKDKGLVILGLNASDNKKIALDFMRENGATFPNILDSSDAAINVSFRDYRNSACPTNYIIARDGKIVAGWCGYEQGHRRARALLEKLGGELAEAVRQDKK
jgi:peroxiredoxin